jgi:hypothetical protein
MSLLMVPAISWGYSVEVNKVADFPRSFETLAILPASCPPAVDCLWVESLIAGKLVERGLDVVPAAVVRQWMFDSGIKEVTPENRKILAEKLGADAFVVVVVDSMTSETSGSTGVFIGNVFTSAASKRSSGSVQLAVVAADSGKTLMEATGFGESTARPKRGVIGKTFNQIFDRAFNRQFFVDRAKK